LDYSPDSDVVMIDHTALRAAINLLSASPSGADEVTFEIVFSEPVAPTFSASDLVLADGSLNGTIGVSGAGPTYTATVTLADGNADGNVGIRLLDATVTNAEGVPCPAASSPICAVFNWLGFNAEPQDTQDYAGGPVSFEVDPQCGSPTLSYQWKWDDGGKAVRNVGGNAPVYTIPNATPATNGEYWCEVTYDGITHPSAKATLDVQDHLSVIVPPQGGMVPLGCPFALGVVTTGGFLPLEYTWKKDGAVIPGEKGSAYTIPAVTDEDTGAYTVEIADSNGDIVATNPVTLAIGEGMPVAGLAGLVFLTGLLALGGIARMRRA
jgi:Bacterial Ig-like domain